MFSLTFHIQILRITHPATLRQIHPDTVMIPLRDTTRSRTLPIINYLIIGTCGVLFLVQASGGSTLAFAYLYGVIPAELSSVVFHGTFSIVPLVKPLSAMFLHGGLMHLVGNMLYLYVFGDNVEDRLGHGGYFVFYLLCGYGATLAEVYIRPESTIPLIGASGAIAGVLGAYFLLYPRARVLTLIPLFIYFPVVEVSAFFFLGFWFLLQFFQGWMAAGVDGGGVAWWAHAGGFVAGAALLPVFLLMRKR